MSSALTDDKTKTAQMKNDKRDVKRNLFTILVLGGKI